MTDFSLVDEQNGTYFRISNNGELIVAPVSYSIAYYKQIDTAATPVTVVPAETGKIFVITGLLLATSKTFGSSTTGETLTIYETSPSDISIQAKIITQLDMFKNDRLVATGLNLATSEAVTIAAVATDNDVNVTIAGYYVLP